jgi:hypothetical protein
MGGESYDREKDDTAFNDLGGGVGCVVVDVCSGKGFGATLLSYLLPSARLIMLDANGDMDLGHVQARSNMSFVHVDVFTSACVKAIQRALAEAQRDLDDGVDGCIASPTPRKAMAVLTGVHLCGALSPRLIDLTFGIDGCRGSVLCPCCLKGKLGGDCVGAARQATDGSTAYSVLVDTLKAHALSTATASAEVGIEVDVSWDAAVLSPKNAFLTVLKNSIGT